MALTQPFNEYLAGLAPASSGVAVLSSLSEDDDAVTVSLQSLLNQPAPPQTLPVYTFIYDTAGGSRAAYGILGFDDGDHLGNAHTLLALQNRPVGSGTNGPGNADYGLIVSNIKKDVTTTSIVGELNGVYSIVRNGAAGSDGCGFLADVATYGTGFLGILEGVTNIFTGGGSGNPYSIGVQVGILDNVANNYFGMYVAAKHGALSAAYWANSQDDGTWSDLFRGQKLGNNVFTVDGDGNVLVENGGNITSKVNGASTTIPRFTAEQSGAGDVLFEWLLTGTRSWVAGIDNSDSDAWKLSSSNDGFGTATCLRVDVAGRVQAINPTGGLGYGTGAGGTVTQATDKSTTVTLDKVTGRITMHNALLVASTIISFTVLNSTVEANDLVLVNYVSGGTANSYDITVGSVTAGGFSIQVLNRTGAPLSEAIVVGFAVIKGAVS